MPSKLEMAQRFGATHVINSKETDNLVEAVQTIIGGAGVEYAFEAIGVPAAVTQAFSITRPGGTCVVVGMHPLGSQISVPGPDFLQEKKLIGCMYGSTRFREHMPKIVDLFLNGHLVCRRELAPENQRTFTWRDTSIRTRAGASNGGVDPSYYLLALGLPVPTARVTPAPLVSLHAYDVVFAFDHDTQQGWVISQGVPAQGPQARRQRASERLDAVLAHVAQASACECALFGKEEPSPAEGVPNHDPA